MCVRFAGAWRASEVDDDVESQRPSEDTMMMIWMRTTTPMNMMMIVMMMVMAQLGIEAWVSERTLGHTGCFQCNLGAWGVRSLLVQRGMEGG